MNEVMALAMTVGATRIQILHEKNLASLGGAAGDAAPPEQGQSDAAAAEDTSTECPP